MPCMDGGPSQDQIDRENRDKKAVYRLACERCKWYEGIGASIPEWAREWWEFHKAEDEKEFKRKTLAKLKEEQIRIAKSKLTTEEKRILGL